MSQLTRLFKINILAVLLIGFLTVSVNGSEFKPVADEMFGGSGVSWAPKVNYHKLVVTIPA